MRTENSTGNVDGQNHLGILDGLRGMMAFWVFYGHAQIATTGEVPRFGHPASAVDVFMLLSGFLMFYQWARREEKFGSTLKQTFDFYIRRFFRIAPLYYFAIFFALGFSRFFAPEHSMSSGGAVLSGVGANFWNVLAHVSFVFGALPRYVSNNVLPDWSIGLEMQFYLAFPLLLMVLRKIGPVSLLGAVFFCGVGVNSLFSLYDEPPKVFGNYPQPGLLFFKLHIFFGGMLIAKYYLSKRRSDDWPLLVIAISALLWKTSIQVKCITFCTVYLLLADKGQRELVHRLLAGRVARFLGDTSYGVYLIHTMLLAISLASLREWKTFESLGPTLRFLTVFAILVPIVYGSAFLLHRYLELPGIRLGRLLCARIHKNGSARNLGFDVTVPQGAVVLGNHEEISTKGN